MHIEIILNELYKHNLQFDLPFFIFRACRRRNTSPKNKKRRQLFFDIRKQGENRLLSKVASIENRIGEVKK